MIRRVRLVIVMTRPAVAFLLGLYAALGLASAGHGEDRWLLAGSTSDHPAMAYPACDR